MGGAGTKDIGSPALYLGLPGCDLIEVHVQLLRQLSQHSIALMTASAALALNAGVWFRRIYCLS